MLVGSITMNLIALSLNDEGFLPPTVEMSNGPIRTNLISPDINKSENIKKLRISPQ